VTFEQFVAHVKASACIARTDDFHVPSRPRILRRIMENLTPKQIELLLDLLEGKAVLQRLERESYVVKRVGDGWQFTGVDAGVVTHTVTDAGVCSCPGYRFHGTECRHIRAWRELQG